MKNQNVYNYNVNTGAESGTFYITQDTNGSIILIMNGKYTVLSLSQIIDLDIVVQNLIDFDYDDYKCYYKIK